MTSPTGIGVIGCGDIANQQHLPTLLANPDVQVPIVCDLDPGRAEATSKRFEVPAWTTDVDEVLNHPDVRAVIVATPPWVTPRITIRALRAGKDVLCEKPIALTLDEARAVAATEAETGRRVQIGFVLRHGRLFAALRDWIADGRLGSPLTLRIGVFDETWNPEGDPEHYGRILKTLEHGAPCIHDGAHTMDHLHFLLGTRAERISAWGTTTRPEFPRPNLNTAVIDFPGGHRARVEISWFLPVFPEGEFEIVGPLGVASFLRYERSAVLRTAVGEERVTIEDEWISDCFREQLRAFVRGVSDGVWTGPESADAIASLALSQAFELAMSEDGKPLELVDGMVPAR